MTAAEKTLDSFIDAYTEANGNTGSLRVTLKDRIVYERTIGEGITPSSMFTFYSLSKPFCAIGLLLLRDKGLVDLDSHPGRYVGGASGFDSRVTIRQMLHHTSGLPDFARIPDFDDSDGDVRKNLSALSKYPMEFEPGTSALYSNINFNLCAMIIENVAGMPYAEYMKRELFDPIGMKTAAVDREGLEISGRVQGYEQDGEKIVPASRTMRWMVGAGDIIGTVDDAYCLNRAIKCRMLLKSVTWDEVLDPSPLNSMGMGCTVGIWHGRRRITHNGGHIGFRTLHIQLPEDDFDIVYLSNSGWGNSRNDYAEAIYSAFYGKE